MCNPLFVANNIIDRAKKENISITPMKLQKILYFVYRDYLQKQKDGIPLFAERFATWKYGPVLESVYTAFKKYGSEFISDYYREDGKAYAANEESNGLLGQVLNDVWNKTKKYNGIQLSKITHKENSAWYKAFQNQHIFLDDKDIKNDKIEISLNE